MLKRFIDHLALFALIVFGASLIVVLKLGEAFYDGLDQVVTRKGKASREDALDV